MARQRINTVAICSSENYEQSRKLHIAMLERNHRKLNRMIIEEKIVITKKAYVKCFGSYVAIPENEIQEYERITKVYWL